MKHEVLAEGIEIYQGDCLDVMPTLDEKSINLVIADPPYNIGKAEWDKIPNYIEWCGKWILECQRVLADNGSFYFFHNDMETIADLMVWIRENTNFVFKQFIVWNKRFESASNKGFLDGFIVPDGLRNYQQMAEYILFYTFQDETGLNKILKQDGFYGLMEYFKREREKLGWNYIKCDEFLGIKASYCYWDKPTTHPYRIPEESHYKKLQTTGYFKREYEDLRREYEDLRREYEDLRYTFNNQKTHHSVWNYEIAERNGHATPKPVDMIENILLHSSNEGDTVLDCFVGSGTTLEACVNTGRRGIGIDNSPVYYNITKKRTLEALMQPRLEFTK